MWAVRRGAQAIGGKLTLSSISIQDCQPLYSRAPGRDEDGRCLSDFMMLISGMREWPGHRRADTISQIHAVLNGYSEVVFADLNLHLNLLWVSVRPRYGVIVEICTQLQQRIPEAKLVGSYSG